MCEYYYQILLVVSLFPNREAILLINNNCRICHCDYFLLVHSPSSLGWIWSAFFIIGPVWAFLGWSWVLTERAWAQASKICSFRLKKTYFGIFVSFLFFIVWDPMVEIRCYPANWWERVQLVGDELLLNVDC